MALRPCENSCQRDGGCFWVCLTLFWPVMLVLAGTFAYLGVTFLKNRALLGELWKLLDAADSIGRKLFTLGRDTLLGAVAGNRRCWADLKKYNAQDVLLLERVCLKLRPWATTHPNLSHYTQAPRARCVGQRLAVPSRICQDRFHFE